MLKNALLSAIVLSAACVAAQDASKAPHKVQTEELADMPEVVSEDAAAAAERAKEKKAPLEKSATTRISDDFIVLGYIQTEDRVYHYRWNSLTHVASTFNSFDSAGNLNNSPFANRSSYLKAGGAAQAAGVKVLLTVLNSGFDVNVIESVMTSSTARATLLNDIVSTVTADSYCAGVTFDFEPFSWSAAARDGMTTFFSDLRTALPSPYEISVYVDVTPSATQWDIPGLEPNIDYVTYSAYDWATGDTAHAITDFNNTISHTRALWYLDQGLPPEKLVYTFSTYSRYWSGITSYNSTGTQVASGGFTDGLFDTTLNTNNGGPQTNNYLTGDEVSWYTWNSGGTDYVRTWDNQESIAYMVGNALATQDGSGTWAGRRLGGVGFWSLRWLAETSSYDPRTSSSTTRTRTYPHVYQILQETLAAPGETDFIIDSFEGYDFRWRDPNLAPDTAGDTNGDSDWDVVASPGGAGAPPNTANAARVTFDFENASGNQLVFAHEVLANSLVPSIPDTNAVAAVLSANMAVKAYVYTPSTYAGRQIRMMLIDANNEIEVSDPYTLNASGWRQIEWDLTDAAQINAFTTSEPAFSNGDGVLDTAGGGKRDLGFFGFLIEGGAAGGGNVYIDEVTYSHAVAAGEEYTINEFRYDNGATDDAEFVEIYGPAGALPAGFQLRQYDPADGSILSSWNLSGSIANDTGTGFGFFVVGDPGVPNVNSTAGFSAATDDLSDANPGSLQLYNTSTGAVYDSVVYEAFGGLGDLIRLETNGVANEGYPWIGRSAYGTGPEGTYTKGRYPDGADTNVNHKDFSSMAASPGAPNGGFFGTGVTFDFSTAPSGAFQTFQDLTPVASGVGPSPSGGNVHRCIDTSGGGVISFFGDKSLGADGNGYIVTGELYIPAGAEPAQAIAVGICGTDGSAFFSDGRAGNSYENGYWLIYENAAGVGLDNGRPDHPGTFEFVHATHDNMDGKPVELLGSATRASTGATEGTWTTFELAIDPNEAPGAQLAARINGADVYTGSIPADGPTQGAFQVGFRENHAGSPASNEGTWVDNISIQPAADVVPPTADAIILSGTSPTNASTVSFNVSFSEPVVNFNSASDVVVTHSGTSSTGVAITPNGADYIVDITGVSGDGTFTLAVSTASNIEDVAGNPLASSVTSAAVEIDNTPPASSVNTVADNTLVGPSVSLGFTAADLNGIASVSLYVRQPASSTFVDSGLSPSGNTFNYTFSTDGIHAFYTIATDAVGNVESAPATADETVIVNIVANSTFTAEYATDGMAVFPMESDKDVLVTLTGVTTPGTLTISRTKDNSGASAAGLDPARLIDQYWTITPGGGLIFTSANVVLEYDDALTGSITEAEINAVFQVDGSSYTQRPVAVDTGADTLTFTTTSFSDWYAGNNDARTDAWMILGD